MPVSILDITNKSCITLFQVCDYLPIVATVSNLAQTLFKIASSRTSAKSNTSYLHYVSQKTYLELFVKTLPIIGQFYAIREAFLCKSCFYLPPDSFQKVAIEKMARGELSFDALPMYYSYDQTFIKKAALSGINVSNSIYFNSDFEIFKACAQKYPETLLKQSNIHFINHQEISDLAKKNHLLLKHLPPSFNAQAAHLELAVNKLSGDDLYHFLAKFYTDKKTHKFKLLDQNLGIDLLDILKKAPKTLCLIALKDQTKNHVKTAINKDGLTIRYAAAKWQNDLELIDDALKQNPLALEYINPDLVSKETFRQCVDKNPLAWSFGSLSHQEDIDLHFKVILKNPKADLKLFKTCGGCLENMVFQLSKITLQKNPFNLLKIPFPYLSNEKTLNYLLTIYSGSELTHILKKLEWFLPDAFKRYRSNPSYANFFDLFDKKALSTIVDPNDLSGACVLLKLNENKDAFLGYDLIGHFRKINKSFIQEQKKVHASKKWHPIEASSWEEAFKIMKKHASYKDLKAILDKEKAFKEERSFYASSAEKSESLRLYYKQTKKQLSQIAGYIQSNPGDQAAIKDLIEAFQVCAGGIMAHLAEMVDFYCEFSGNPPLEYRIAKLIQNQAEKGVLQSGLKTYPAYNVQGSLDVHARNHLAKRFNAFYLDSSLDDPYGPQISGDLQAVAFFNAFNTHIVFEEIYQESKSSKAFKEALIEFIKKNIDQFPDIKQEAQKTSSEPIAKAIAILDTHRATYVNFDNFLQPLPKPLQDIILNNMRQGGALALIKRSLSTNLNQFFIQETNKALLLSPPVLKQKALSDLGFSKETSDLLIASKEVNKDILEALKTNVLITQIQTQTEEFRAPIKLFLNALLELKGLLNLDSTNKVLTMYQENKLSIAQIDTILTSIPYNTEELVNRFCQKSYDEDGHFTKEALLTILDKTGVFTNPY